MGSGSLVRFCRGCEHGVRMNGQVAFVHRPFSALQRAASDQQHAALFVHTDLLRVKVRRPAVPQRRYPSA